MATTDKNRKIARKRALVLDEAKSVRTRVRAARAWLRQTNWSQRAVAVVKKLAKTLSKEQDPILRETGWQLFEFTMKLPPRNPKAKRLAEIPDDDAFEVPKADLSVPPVGAIGKARDERGVWWWVSPEGNAISEAPGEN